MSDYEYAITDDEQRWIDSLRRLAAKRPKTLGLWGGGANSLSVVALTEDGAFMHGPSSDERVCMVTTVPIPAGGGDPEWVCVEDIDRPWVR